MELTAAACASPEHETPDKLFALYIPAFLAYNPISMRGGIDVTNKQLKLTMTKNDKPISHTVMLQGNQLRVHDRGSFHDFCYGREPVRLSLAAHNQYRGISSDGKSYVPVEDSDFRGVYICGRFLIITEGSTEHVRPLPTLQISSIEIFMRSMKSKEYATVPAAAHPFIVVDLSLCLTTFFGADWASKLPIYRIYATKEIMTQAEFDARYPKK
jgi:hypothetical protein